MEMEKNYEERKVAELKDKGNKEFEHKIENGKVTFDHTGKLLSVSHIKADKLPNDYRKVVSHNIEIVKQEDTTKKLKIKKTKEENESDNEKNTFHPPEETLVSKFKDSNLIKSHLNAETSKDGGKCVQSIKPSDGVIYQPNIDSPEKIKGEPYNQQQREFQEKVLRKISQRHLSIKDIAKQMIRRTSTLNTSKINEGSYKSIKIIGVNDSYTETTDDKILEDETMSRANSTSNAKKNLFTQRLKHNQSHEPILNRNEYSFINTKLDSSDIKQHLMDYDMNKTFDSIGLKSNLGQSKTSLMLPPISIGNMQSTLNLNDEQKLNNNKRQSKIRFVSPIQSVRGMENFTNRSKVSIKSEIAEKFRSSSTSRDVVYKKTKGSPSDISYEEGDKSLPNIDSLKIHKLAKRPSKTNRLSFAFATSASFGLSNAPVTKKLKKQMDFIKSLEKAKLNLRSKIYAGDQEDF